jgi:hypothetical protein
MIPSKLKWFTYGLAFIVYLTLVCWMRIYYNLNNKWKSNEEKDGKGKINGKCGAIIHSSH